MTICQHLQDHRDESIENQNLYFFHKHLFEKIITKINN